MNGDLYYDRDGNPMTLEEWGSKFEDFDYKRVALDTVVVWGQTYRVSTVWLGMDHGFGATDLPIIFETMVFEDGSGDDKYMNRYSTEAEALLGHRDAVARLRDGVLVPHD